MTESPNRRTDANLRGWYFSPSDGGIEHVIRPDHFRDSLVFHLLFEPSPLIVTDVFFFNCRYLIEHLEGSRYPLFLRALKAGLVIPAFRSQGTETFAQSLDDIGLHGIFGIERDQFQQSPQDLAERLDGAFTASETNLIVWPDNMGASFGELARRVLAEQAELRTDDERLAIMWRRIEPFRVGCLEEAERLTSAREGTGVRRAEIFNAVGKKLGLLSGDTGFSKPRDLLDAVKRTDHLRPLPVYDEIELLVDTVNLCYQQSQADQFGCGHNIPGVLARNAVPLHPELGRRTAGLTPVTFQVEVQLPSLATLSLADSAELFAIRNGDPAQQYFDMRAAWAVNPSPDRADNLRKAIFDYAAALREAARGPRRSTMIGAMTTMARPGVELLGSAVGAALGSYIDTDALPKPFGAVVGAITGGVGGMLVTAFQELRDGPYVPTRKRDITIESVLRRPDVNVPKLS
ncbi:hypothetical protein [Sphaerisporangium dianthi]|uniref:Uncharacterized protein n=1 Tax=Sphaerisporangium dianthi TaxID=1436120 RepID=A0ABV9CJL3_9ACTN